MTRAIVITNPVAARTDVDTLRDIERVFRSAGWDIETHATSGPGGARQLAQYGVDRGADVVAVFGGDGTTMQAAAALVGTDIPLGVLPGGTGNQLALNLKLPTNPVKAAAALVRGTARPFDLGRVERQDGVHYFAVACGTGMDARVMAETSTANKQRWGMMAYMATTLRLLPDVTSHPFHITIDGRSHEAEATLVLIANCGALGIPLMKFGTGILPDDGVLDVVVLQARSFGGGVRAVWDLMTDAKGTYGKDVFAAQARGTEITVELATGSQPVQLDGEPIGGTPFTVTIAPRAIRVIYPEG